MTHRTLAQTQQQVPTTSPLSRGSILQRKCESCGNHTIAGGECADCGKKKSSLQRKLAIGASNDPLEQEADRVADQVMAASASSAVSSAPPRIQRFTGQPTGQADMAAPTSVDRVLSSPGRPLEPALQQDMGQRFSHDFSQVRVHTDAAAEQSAREVNANAYTVGHNVVLGAGRFAPGTHEGRRLIAHELTHVVQQSGADGIRADLGNLKRGLSPFSLQQQVAAGRPFFVRRVPGDGEPSPPVVSLPSKSENQARLAELMDNWVPSPEKQRSTTISRAAAIELKTGKRVYLVAIAGEGAALPLDHSLLMPDEIPVPYVGGHAEIQTMHFAAKEGYKILPGALEPSRAFCTNCAIFARQEQLTPPDANVRLGRLVKPLSEVSNKELAEKADPWKKPGWRGELTEKGKEKQSKKPITAASEEPRIRVSDAPPINPSPKITPKTGILPGSETGSRPSPLRISAGRKTPSKVNVRVPRGGRGGSRSGSISTGLNYGLAAAILVVSQVMFMQYVSKLYGQEVDEHNRKKFDDALKKLQPDIERVIAEGAAQIQQWQENGREVSLLVALESRWSDTDIGSIVSAVWQKDALLTAEGLPPLKSFLERYSEPESLPLNLLGYISDSYSEKMIVEFSLEGTRSDVRRLREIGERLAERGVYEQERSKLREERDRLIDTLPNGVLPPGSNRELAAARPIPVPVPATAAARGAAIDAKRREIRGLAQPSPVLNPEQSWDVGERLRAARVELRLLEFEARRGSPFDAPKRAEVARLLRDVVFYEWKVERERLPADERARLENLRQQLDETTTPP